MALEQRELAKLLETAVVAARLAGQRAMEEIGYTKASVKNDTELVTKADLHCQQIIIEKIKQTYPDHGFLAEESPEHETFKQAPRGRQSFWWIIDPIDGTNNFAHRLPIFAVSIAVMHENKPVAAVVFDPATDAIFTAVENGQAQLNGRTISAGNEKISPYAEIGLDSHFGQPTPKWASEIMSTVRFRNLGTTALQLAYVANGSFIATIACTPKLWDIAAGVFIAQTAGAKVADFKGNEIFPLDVENYQPGPLPTLATNKKVHPELLKMLSSEAPA